MSYRGHVKTVEWGGLDQFLSSLPVMVFAYTCHQNVRHAGLLAPDLGNAISKGYRPNHRQMFSILNEIKDNSPAQTTSVVTASALSSGSVYVLVALTGYLSFGDRVNGNVVSMCMSQSCTLFPIPQIPLTAPPQTSLPSLPLSAKPPS